VDTHARACQVALGEGRATVSLEAMWTQSIKQSLADKVSVRFPCTRIVALALARGTTHSSFAAVFFYRDPIHLKHPLHLKRPKTRKRTCTLSVALADMRRAVCVQLVLVRVQPIASVGGAGCVSGWCGGAVRGGMVGGVGLVG
jgi:hypothetical protein